MHKPLGGLVSSLVFVLACEDASGPQQVATAKTEAQGGSDAAVACPQIVQFDPDTGRITIVDPQLSNQLRDFYGVKPGAAGSGEAVIVFFAGAEKAGQDGDSITNSGTIVNLRC